MFYPGDNDGVSTRKTGRSCSFLFDERGVTEPYTDLPALGIVAVGFIVFGYLMLSAYSAYASATYDAALRTDLMSTADAIASDPALAVDGHPGMLDAMKLNAAGKKSDPLVKFGYPGAPVAIEVEAGQYRWHIGKVSQGKASSCSRPITLMVNDARCVPGTLTVTMWER